MREENTTQRVDESERENKHTPKAKAAIDDVHNKSISEHFELRSAASDRVGLTNRE
jgi:hypothetical protein